LTVALIASTRGLSSLSQFCTVVVIIAIFIILSNYHHKNIKMPNAKQAKSIIPDTMPAKIITLCTNSL